MDRSGRAGNRVTHQRCKMLKTRLLHPQILEALAEAGHGSRILIADSNFPMLTGSAASARRAI